MTKRGEDKIEELVAATNRLVLRVRELTEVQH